MTNTLQRIAPQLDRLFADADLTRAAMQQQYSHMTRAEIAAAAVDYRGFYHALKDVHLPVSRESGRLLYMLARAKEAKTIVEYGTSFALSTLHLAAALRDNGGGQLIGTELEPNKVAAARATLATAELADLVEIRQGDALETLASNLPRQIDLVLLDGHKPLYARVLALLAPNLRSGAFILADNADACPEYVALVRAPGSGYMSVPFADDVELSVKL